MSDFTRNRFLVREFAHNPYRTVQHVSVLKRMETHMPTATRLPETGYVRLTSIIGPNGPIPVSRSTWWEGVRTGRFPQPVKLGPRITAWRVEDIRALIEQPSKHQDGRAKSCGGKERSVRS